MKTFYCKILKRNTNLGIAGHYLLILVPIDCTDVWKVTLCI